MIDYDRYAELVLRVGVDFQPGQGLLVNALVEHAPLARALARAAYTAGARFVDVHYEDRHNRRALIELAPDETLSFSPPWLLGRLDQCAGERAALVSLTGDPEPDLLAGTDGDRAGRARQGELLAKFFELAETGELAWTVAACPSAGWADAVFGEPDVERLWSELAPTVRLDEPDPPAAWRAHLDVLNARAAALTAHDFDALRFRGPGTDLTIGLLPRTRWFTADAETNSGRRYVPNLPTEEVLATPDCRRTEGTVRATRPLVLQGTLVRGLELRFEAGRAVEVEAETGAEVVRRQLETDAGAAALGEVALVDGESRVGRSGLVFLSTLLDENATCHIAYGRAATPVEGVDGTPAERRAAGVNDSALHVDFMVGGPEVRVDGVTRDGHDVPILHQDRWLLPAAP
jgi:aminopeptidase